MPDVLRRLHGPAFLPATTAATFYTVPANTTAVVRYIRFLNTTGTDRTVTISINADVPATGVTRVFMNLTVPANSSFEWAGSIPLAAGEFLQGFASLASSVTVIVSGVEVS